MFYEFPDMLLVLKGIQRDRKIAPKLAHPMTLSILLKIRDNLDLYNPVHATMWSLFLTSFFLMLHKSNVCHTYGTARNYLKRKHVNVKQNCILVQIFWTKTLKLGEKILEMLLLLIPGSSLCPVSVMKHMLDLTPMNRESVLCSFPNGKAVNYNFYQKFLKNQIKKIS